MHLFVIIPTRERVLPMTMIDLWRAGDALRAEGVSMSIGVEMTSGYQIACDLAVARFWKKEDATHLLILDDDVARFSGADLLRMMRSGHELVGGPLPARSPDPGHLTKRIRAGAVPFDRVLEHLSPLLIALPKERSERAGDYVRVDGVAGGFMMMTRACVATMREKYSARRAMKEGAEVFDLFERFANADGEQIGPDFAFCARYRDAGGTVWADLKTQLVHFGFMPFMTPTLEELLTPPAMAR